MPLTIVAAALLGQGAFAQPPAEPRAADPLVAVPAEAEDDYQRLQAIAATVAARAPSWDAQDSQFALAATAQVTLEAFIAAENVVETTAATTTGERVTIRVIGDEEAMTAFAETTADPAKVKQASLEAAEMAGAPALKRRGEDGSLTVAVMSEKDHALIEIEGDDPDAVMAFIGEFEASMEKDATEN
ncbi:MAG: hypothetical protein AAGJ87_09950 [Pseudomonadota bacterium]